MVGGLGDGRVHCLGQVEAWLAGLNCGREQRRRRSGGDRPAAVQAHAESVGAVVEWNPQSNLRHRRRDAHVEGQDRGPAHAGPRPVHVGIEGADRPQNAPHRRVVARRSLRGVEPSEEVDAGRDEVLYDDVDRLVEPHVRDLDLESVHRREIDDRRLRPGHRATTGGVDLRDLKLRRVDLPGRLRTEVGVAGVDLPVGVAVGFGLKVRQERAAARTDDAERELGDPAVTGADRRRVVGGRQVRLVDVHRVPTGGDVGGDRADRGAVGVVVIEAHLLDPNRRAVDEGLKDLGVNSACARVRVLRADGEHVPDGGADLRRRRLEPAQVVLIHRGRTFERHREQRRVDRCDVAAREPNPELLDVVLERARRGARREIGLVSGLFEVEVDDPRARRELAIDDAVEIVQRSRRARRRRAQLLDPQVVDPVCVDVGDHDERVGDRRGHDQANGERAFFRVGAARRRRVAVAVRRGRRRGLEDRDGRGDRDRVLCNRSCRQDQGERNDGQTNQAASSPRNDRPSVQAIAAGLVRRPWNNALAENTPATDRCGRNRPC